MSRLIEYLKERREEIRYQYQEGTRRLTQLEQDIESLRIAQERRLGLGRELDTVIMEMEDDQ